MTILKYDTLNNLPEISFISGTDKKFTFTAYQEDGITLLNIASGNIIWMLYSFGESNVAVITKTGVIIDANRFTVTLTSSDTILLSGNYIQQPIIQDFIGNIFRPGQGNVLILPAIPSS